MANKDNINHVNGNGDAQSWSGSSGRKIFGKSCFEKHVRHRFNMEKPKMQNSHRTWLLVKVVFVTVSVRNLEQAHVAFMQNQADPMV